MYCFWPRWPDGAVLPTTMLDFSFKGLVKIFPKTQGYLKMTLENLRIIEYSPKLIWGQFELRRLRVRDHLEDFRGRIEKA